MKPITSVGKEMLAFQERLALEYNYKPIGFNLFTGDVRQKYIDNLPGWCNVTGDNAPLYTLAGDKVANLYSRIVIGDYGAFIEIPDNAIIKDALIIQPGQEYRLAAPRFAENVKYIWYTDRQKTGAKFYYQKKTVEYADYRVGRWYVSPYHVEVK